MTGGRLADAGGAEARLEVGFRPDPQLWPADLLAADEDTMTAGSDWLDQARRLLDTFVQGQPPRPAAAGRAAARRRLRPVPALPGGRGGAR